MGRWVTAMHNGVSQFKPELLKMFRTLQHQQQKMNILEQEFLQALAYSSEVINMVHKNGFDEIIIMCSAWWNCSWSFNDYSSLFRPDPRTSRCPSHSNVPKRYYFTMIIPLALGKFLSSLSSHVSIWIVSVSYAHTVKATLPLFTVVLSRVLLGETQTLPVYLSLLPIIGGVIIATLTEVSFEFMGLLSALGATLGFSLMTIFSKKCLHETGLHHLRLLVLLCRISALCFFPVWLIFDFRKIISSDDTVVEGKSLATPVLLLFFDGLFSMLQNVFAFTVLAMVSTLSYAVANATKRVVIIGASLFVLTRPITMSNFIGMMVAIFGVLVYNKGRQLSVNNPVSCVVNVPAFK
ncbi:SLC35E1 [Mytilus edulis]|uniref:SLC35E1 n=1 Tax=Mytilus edulis TaxID=6550 RepID=A0A8S3RZ09_MYTED|nr:SLC35E1 [Mytilus edulis]